MARVAVPGDSQDQVLLLSLRRCCICFVLHSDFDVKQGQVAHLDQDNTNYNLDNLAFLCLPHHDQYDSRTSQSKGFRESEVKRYRERLYERIAELPQSERMPASKFPSGEAEPNLLADFDAGPIGPIYLTPEGVWSASNAGSGVQWLGLRMNLSNLPIQGKKVGPAKGVSVRIKFEHDTGLDAACASPTAWLHEKRGYVDLNPGEEKQAIIAVRSNSEWFTVTNVRDSSGYPNDTSAMNFNGAPWFSGKLHIGLIVNGEVVEKHYSWEVSVTHEQGILKSGIPKIRPLP